MPAASGSMEGGSGMEESNSYNQDESSYGLLKKQKMLVVDHDLLRYCKKQLGWLAAKKRATPPRELQEHF